MVQNSGRSNRTILHETLHFIGLSDRYDERLGPFNQGPKVWTNSRASEVHPGFEGDRMGTPNGTGFDAWYYLQYKLYGESLPASKAPLTSYPAKKFVDRNAEGRTRTPYEPSGVHTDLNPIERIR